MVVFRLAIAFLCLLWGFPAYSSPEIRWHLKHPFRYFVETTDFNMHREAMADVLAANGGALSATAVSDLERLVNDPRWLREWYRLNPGAYPEAHIAGRPERGWAHHINRRRGTCWDSRQQWHASCKSDTFGVSFRTDYVRPQRHTVILRIADPPAGQCRWSAPRAIFIVGAESIGLETERPCGEDVEGRIPFEPDRPERERGVAVSVTLPDGTMLSHDRIWVRDRLVVGMGDSFSSGEGNPDTPVEIDRFSHRAGLNISFVYDPARQAIRSVPAYSLPVRMQNVPAGWLDRKCHRSAYSYHLRTALQIALADPVHSAVTFLGFACSGAEITEGMLLPYAGVETVEPSYFTGGGRSRRNLSQIDRLMIELCAEDLSGRRPTRAISLDQPVTVPSGRPIRNVNLLSCPGNKFLRQIDLLIISIGGNDVGFTPLVANVLTKARPPYANALTRRRANLLGADVIRTLARLTKAHGVERAQQKARELPARFSALRKALAPFPFATNGAGKPNIVLTAFPLIEFNENGVLCGTTDPRERLEGFNVGGVFSIDVPTLRPVSRFANEILYPATREAARVANWYFVDAHRDAFSRHGICAQRQIGGGMSAAENLMLPYYHFASPRNKWSDFEPFAANREDDFVATRDTRAYAPRQRWFRTLNDICLFVQYKANGTPPPPAQWGLLDLVEACLGGPFHPTAEGHAHIADAVFNRAAQILALPQPTEGQVRPH